MALQSYTLPQLVRLELIAFRADWEEALEYVGYDRSDAIFIARSINTMGLIRYLREYQVSLKDLEELIDFAVCYLINKFDIT